MLLSLSESEQAHRDQFEYLADCLLKRGQTDPSTKEVFPAPSARALMERFGGSMITANERMEQFHAIVARSLESAAPTSSDFPTPVIEAMHVVMEQAREEARSEVDITIAAYESEKAEFEAQRSKLVSSLKRMQEALSAEQAAHRTTREQAKAEIDAAISQNGSLEQLEAELEALRTVNEEIETHNKDLHAELDGQKKAREQLSVELDQSRVREDESKQRILALEKRISELTTDQANVSNETGRLSDNNRELSAELDAVRAELLTAEKRRVDTLERLQKTQAEIYSLKADLSDKASELKKLQNLISNNAKTAH